MSESPTDLMLIFLRRLDTNMTALCEEVREHGHRLARIEGSIAGLRRDQAGDAETTAHI